MKNTINQRIREFINSLEINDNQFAKSIGVTQSVIASMFSRNTEPSSKVLSLILNAYANLSAEWLLRGIGDMYIKKSNDEIVNNAVQKYDAEVEIADGVITIRKK